ncbi:hypothetical protein ACGFIW_15605 [Micromonospora sp. NPDC048935]|uniref:hypothetical protein n=1 Tax=Micromonospora sp. NPDC048935 TaxID=3364262 RepID=UPI00371D0460
MGRRIDQDSDVRRLLYELGFCLPPEELDESPPGDVDAFTVAFFEAEGMGDMSRTNLRRQVREVVDRHMGGCGD